MAPSRRSEPFGVACFEELEAYFPPPVLRLASSNRHLSLFDFVLCIYSPLITRSASILRAKRQQAGARTARQGCCCPQHLHCNRRRPYILAMLPPCHPGAPVSVILSARLPVILSASVGPPKQTSKITHSAPNITS